MGWFDQIRFDNEIDSQYGVVLRDLYQTKDLLSDQPWLEGVRTYRVRADGSLMLVAFKRICLDDGSQMEHEEFTPCDYSGTIDFYTYTATLRLRAYTATFRSGALVSIVDASVLGLEGGVVL